MHMKKFGKPEIELTKVFAAVTTAILLCICIWLFLNSQTAMLSEGYIDGVAKNNEYIVDLMAADIAVHASSENEAVGIIKNAPSSSVRYWFLLSSEELVFERSADTTAAIGRLNYSELEEYYVRQGGQNIAGYFNLIKSGEDFSAVVIKDSAYRSELISARFLVIGGEKYCVGTGVSQSFMLSSAKLGERIITLKIIALVLCAAVILLTASCAFANRKKTLKISVLQNDLASKNILVQGHGERLAAIESDGFEKSDDTPTGLYNKIFFDAVIKKLSARKTENVGIIYIRLTNLMTLNYEKGFAYTSQLIMDIADKVKSYATEKDICAHVSKNEYVMLKLNTTSDETRQTAKMLYDELRSSNPSVDIAAGSSFKSEDMTIEAALDAALAATPPVL